MNVVSPYEAATMSMRKGIPNRLGCFLTTWFIELRRSGREEKCVIEWTRSRSSASLQVWHFASAHDVLTNQRLLQVTTTRANQYLRSKRNLKEDIDWSESLDSSISSYRFLISSHPRISQRALRVGRMKRLCHFVDLVTWISRLRTSNAKLPKS